MHGLAEITAILLSILLSLASKNPRLDSMKGLRCYLYSYVLELGLEGESLYKNKMEQDLRTALNL